jgi:hypothetical protein
MKMIYKTFVVLLFSCFAWQGYGQQVNFSVQAHQDDWQLFMSSAVTADIKAGKKIVCITLTAGDGGDGTASGFGTPIPYFLARENGSVYSSKFAADMDYKTPFAIPTATRVNILGHSIIKYVYQNTVNYFLRLPDGAPLGDGSPTTGSVSLQKLKTGVISNIAAIDGFTIYNSWTDLVNTIRSIVNIERGSQSQVWMYTPSLNPLNNPNDHSDHIYSAQAAQEAVNDWAWVGIKEFADYYSASQPPNLIASDHEDASAVFGMCEWGLAEAKYFNHFNPEHKRWLPMDYSATKRLPVGIASGTFTLLTPPNPGSPNTGNSTVNTNTATTTNGLESEIPNLHGIIALILSAANNNNFDIRICPERSGIFNTKILDRNGNLLFNKTTLLANSAPFVVKVQNVITAGGLYVIKTTLNGVDFETRTIVLE